MWPETQSIWISSILQIRRAREVTRYPGDTFWGDVDTTAPIKNRMFRLQVNHLLSLSLKETKREVRPWGQRQRFLLGGRKAGAHDVHRSPR